MNEQLGRAIKYSWANGQTLHIKNLSFELVIMIQTEFRVIGRRFLQTSHLIDHLNWNMFK